MQSRSVCVVLAAAFLVGTVSCGTALRGNDATASTGDYDLANYVDAWNLDSVRSDEDMDGLFHRFASAYKRSYSKDEVAQRFATFKDNVSFMKQSNGEQNEYRLGITTFADQSFDEFKKNMLNSKVAILANRTAEAATPFTASSVMSSVPKSFDWRGYRNVLSPVGDQGTCGSCWTWSATGALEAAYSLKYHTPVVLSKQALIDCDREENNGCDGGDEQSAFLYVDERGGLPTERDYPYMCEDKDASECKRSRCHDTRNVEMGVRGRSIRANDERSIEAAIAHHGPLTAAIDATSTLQHYTGGVLKDKRCSEDEDKANHAILIVGYNAETFTVKNSWSTEWGVAGYVYFRRNNQCGLTNYTSFPEIN